MKRRAALVVLFAIAALLLALALRSVSGIRRPSAPGAADRSAPAGRGSALPTGSPRWLAPVPAGRGALAIQGQVRGPAGPVAGATVTATTAQGQEVLSGLRCHCGNDCGQKLLECGCPEASAQLVDLVAERRGEAPPVARATTDAQGAFLLAGLEPGAYEVWADAPGLGSGLAAGVQAGEADQVIEVGGGPVLSGAARDEDGRPLPGAIVTAIHARHSRFFDAVAAADGTFTLGPLPPGRFAVVATHPGLLPAHAHVPEGATRRLELELVAPRRLAGRVTLDGHPVADATVAVRGEHRSLEARTDAEGAFAFSGLRPGTYQLRAAALERVAQRSAEVPKGRDLLGLSLALGAGVLLEGTVLDDQRVPVVGARVSVDERVPARRRAVASAVTDAGGRFRVGPLEPGEYEISAARAGHLPGEDRRVTAVEDQQVELTLPRALAVRGLVVDPDGRPAADAWVRAEAVEAEDRRHPRSDSARSGEDGAFQLDLAAGEYRVVAEQEGFRRAETRVRAPASGLRLALVRGAVVEGSVLDPEGRPVAGAKVVLMRQDGDRSRPAGSGSTDAQGRFRLAGVEPGRLEALAMSGVGEEAPAGMAFARATVDVAPEGTVNLEIRFEAGRAIEGTVVAEDGTPVAGAQVRAWGERSPARGSGAEGRRAPLEGVSVGGAVADAQGAFTVRGLKEGLHRLMVRKEGFDPPREDLRFEAGASGVRIVLPRAAMLRGRVVGDGGAPIAAQVDGQDTAADGTFAVRAGRRTERTVTFTAEGYAPLRRTVTLSPGVDLDLGDVALGHGRTVAGTVVDAATGAPVAGALVVVWPAGEERDGAASPLLLSGRDGRFVLEQAGAQLRLNVSRDGYAAATVEVEATSLTVTVRLGRGATLVVRSLDARGAPWPEVPVAIYGPDVREDEAGGDAQGRHTFSGLRPGTYVVTGDPMGHRRLVPRVVEVAGPAVEVELREQAGSVTLEVSASGAVGEEDRLVMGLVPGHAPAIADPEGLKRGMQAAIEPDEGGPRTRFTALTPGEYTLLVVRVTDGGARVFQQPVQVGESPAQRLEVSVPADLPLLRLHLD